MSEVPSRTDPAIEWCCRHCGAEVDSMGCDTAITRFRDLDGTVQEWTWCSEECLDAWAQEIRESKAYSESESAPYNPTEEG